MQLLALDFDGVISDSAPEAFMVALRTYAALRDDPEVVQMQQRVDSCSVSEIREDSLYARFVDMMALGNRAEDFAVEISLLVRGVDARDQASFDEAFAAEPAGFLESFHERFYETRGALRAADPERWARLLDPYPDFVSVLRRRARDVDLAIATAKDRTSVHLLLRDYGIDDLFPEERLLDKKAGRSKRAHLEHLHARTGVAYSEIVLVDDKLSHLDDVAGLGVSGVLAAWGYNGERGQRVAREHGHRVCSLSDFESRLFAAPWRGAGC
ncbi:MAG: HAD family hydrolase [Myxococcota bacterium]